MQTAEKGQKCDTCRQGIFPLNCAHVRDWCPAYVLCSSSVRHVRLCLSSVSFCFEAIDATAWSMLSLLFVDWLEWNNGVVTTRLSMSGVKVSWLHVLSSLLGFVGSQLRCLIAWWCSECRWNDVTVFPAFLSLSASCILAANDFCKWNSRLFEI